MTNPSCYVVFVVFVFTKARSVSRTGVGFAAFELAPIGRVEADVAV
jgi:hypothetical protein